ncbi:unnamed protein product [Tilletia controversa]|nr:unnamed protein product [Tilletia controversa]
MALLESTPITPLSRVLRESILTGTDTDRLGQHPHRSPGDDDEDHDRWQDDESGSAAGSDNSTDDRPDRPGNSVNLNNSDLQQICVLANKHRSPGQARFVTCFNYNNSDSEFIVDSAASSTPHLKTAEYVLRKRTKQHGARSDPSACIISTPRGQRLAHFQSVIKVRYNDRRSQERTKHSDTWLPVPRL